MSDELTAAAIADRLDTTTPSWVPSENVKNITLSMDESDVVVTALRRLASQDQKPVAWRYRAGDANSWAITDQWRPREDQGWQVEPLYLSPPPAAGWDDAIEAAAKIADEQIDGWCNITKKSKKMLRWWPNGDDIAAEIRALRTGPGATKSDDDGGGVRVKPLEWYQHPETKRYEGVAIVGNNYAVFQAWWGAQNKWGWIGDGEFYHSEVEARQACNADYERRILSALSNQPAPVAANASAEARLREALRDLVALVSTDSAYDDSESLRSARNVLFAENKAALEALSTHPHASDCDKHDDLTDLTDRQISNLLHGRDKDDNGEFTASSMGAAQDALTKSEGGGEIRRPAKTGNKSGAAPEAEQSSPATSLVRGIEEGPTSQARAGVAPGPSEPRGCPTPGACSCAPYQNAAFQNTDDADPALVLAAVRHCASSWVGEARLIGNVRAKDIVRAIDAFTVGRR